MIARRRLQTEATVWSKLSESQQQDEITAAQVAAFDLVRAAVELVATRDNDVIHAQFDGLALKPDGAVQIKLKGHADDDELLKLNRVGKKVLKITVLDEEQFNEQRREMKPDADQKKMAFDEDEKPEAPADGAIADQLREAGYEVNGNWTEIKGDGANEAKSPQWLGGFQSRMGGFPRSLNPFANPDGEYIDGEESDVQDWFDGWDAADESGEAPPLDDATSEPDGAQNAEPETKTDQEPESEAELGPFALGETARLDGKGPDENPFDGGTEEGKAWAEGYNSADAEIDILIEQGYEARKDGQAPERNPWKAGSRENGWWQEGYDKAKSEGLPEE